MHASSTLKLKQTLGIARPVDDFQVNDDWATDFFETASGAFEFAGFGLVAPDSEGGFETAAAVVGRIEIGYRYAVEGCSAGRLQI